MAIDQRSLPLGQRTDALRAKIDADHERAQRLALGMAPAVPREVARSRRVWERCAERLAALGAEQAEARRQRELEDLTGWMDD